MCRADQIRVDSCPSWVKKIPFLDPRITLKNCGKVSWIFRLTPQTEEGSRETTQKDTLWDSRMGFSWGLTTFLSLDPSNLHSLSLIMKLPSWNLKAITTNSPRSVSAHRAGPRHLDSYWLLRFSQRMTTDQVSVFWITGYNPLVGYEIYLLD